MFERKLCCVDRVIMAVITVDPDMKITMLASLAEAHASLNLARKQVIDVEKKLWEMFGMEPNHIAPEPRSQSSEQDRERFAKKRRIDSTSTFVLGGEGSADVKHEDVKEEAEATIPGVLGQDDFPETAVYSHSVKTRRCV